MVCCVVVVSGIPRSATPSPPPHSQHQQKIHAESQSQLQSQLPSHQAAGDLPHLQRLTKEATNRIAQLQDEVLTLKQQQQQQKEEQQQQLLEKEQQLQHLQQQT